MSRWSYYGVLSSKMTHSNLHLRKMISPWKFPVTVEHFSLKSSTLNLFYTIKCTYNHTHINYFHFNLRHKVFLFLSKATVLFRTLDSTFFLLSLFITLAMSPSLPTLSSIPLVLEQFFPTEVLSHFLNAGGVWGDLYFPSGTCWWESWLSLKSPPNSFDPTSKLTLSFCSLSSLEFILYYVFFTHSLRTITTHFYILSTKVKAWQKEDLLFFFSPEFNKNSKHLKVLVTPQM